MQPLSPRLLTRAALQLPLAELAGTFYSTLKSHTSGYATFDYEPGPHRSADLVRLDFLIHGSPVDALSRVLHRADAVTAARAVCQKLVGAVSRQAFEVRAGTHATLDWTLIDQHDDMRPWMGCALALFLSCGKVELHEPSSCVVGRWPWLPGIEIGVVV